MEGQQCLSELTGKCPLCGGRLLYDPSTKHFTCSSCGLYATREEIAILREKQEVENEREWKRRERGEILKWWLSKKKR